jgi:HAD superfamily hydrolase (TIGR01509 family)
MAMEIKAPIAFLFDLDGVLINSCEYHWMSWDLLQKEVPEFRTTKEEFLLTFGKRNDEIFYEKIPGIAPERVEYLSERKEELFREVGKEKIQLLFGMEKFLQQLENEGIPKIIASSTPRSNLNFFLKETIIGKYFNDFIGGDMCPRGKPAPDIFLAAADRLGYKPKNCIVLEDSPAGLKAGRDSGAFVVALATTHDGSHLNPHHFDLLFKDPSVLDLDLILRNAKQK